MKGAGYRGPFGGEGWDGMWTDMSEIVRPTRDGIHGREFISTAVDIGGTPPFLTFDEPDVPELNSGTSGTSGTSGLSIAPRPRVLSIPLPILFDVPPMSVASKTLFTILSQAAQESETLAVVPLAAITRGLVSSGVQLLNNRNSGTTEHLVPLVTVDERDVLSSLSFEPRLIEMAVWDERLYDQIRSRFPESIICLRLSLASMSRSSTPGHQELPEKLIHYVHSGVRVFHLVANYHGRGLDGRFVLDLIREAHRALVAARCRDEVTLLGSGGIIAAEHVPKAIICGLDAVALDTALLVALQTTFRGDGLMSPMSRSSTPGHRGHQDRFQLPGEITVEWGVQRLKNLLGSWRDQMLEVLGAMGLREVRRLRGEVGRAMFQNDLEREAFGEILGYGDRP
ncbi:MAG: glutamate synthase-related protein [Chloroflexota bacterium]